MSHKLNALSCFALMFILLLLLVACKSQAIPDPTETLTSSPTSLAPTSISTDTVAPELSPTPKPTRTPKPDNSPTPRIPTPTSTPCTNALLFLYESVPDDTVFTAGAGFEMMWNLENNGTCTWTNSYRLKFIGGDNLANHSAGSTLPLPHPVAPGERVTIKIRMTAPFSPGTYTANYMLVDQDGNEFGMGSTATRPLYVRIATEPCTFKVALVKDTLSDNTRMFPGEVFTKEWTFKNTGTCTWKEVRLPWVSDGGLTMPPGVPCAGNPHGDVHPGETIDTYWIFIAPQEPGTYRAEFMLADSDDFQFGLGEDVNTPVHVQIVTVDMPSSESDLGSAKVTDTFDKDEGYWPLVQASNENVTYSISNGRLSMDVKRHYEYFMVRTIPQPRGQAHQAVFMTGDSCSSQNAYGLMISLNPTRFGFGEGYLFKITCDGHYTVEYVQEFSYMDGNKPIVLVGPTASSAINPGPNQTNRVAVITAGGRIHLIINGERVLELKGFNATQFQNGQVSNEFNLDLSKFEYYMLPYNNPGQPGLFIDGEVSNFTVFVEEYKFWQIDP